MQDEFNAITITNNTDALNDFFAGEEEPQGISKGTDNDGWEEFDAEITNRSESDTSNIVDLAEDAFIDFDTLQETNLDFLDVNNNAGNATGIIDEFFTQDIQDDSDLADLFSDDGKSAQEDFDLMENEFNFTEDDPQEIPLNLSDEIHDLVTMDLAKIQNEDFEDTYLQTSDLETDLTSIQNDSDLGMEQSDLTAQTTIDNLADFFQGDDDSDVSLLDVNEQRPTDLITDEAFLGLGEFDEFVEQDSPEAIDSLFTQPAEIVGEDQHQQLHTDEIELNGIDDNFDFDDLDAMIGASSVSSEVDNSFNSGFEGFDGQNTATFVSDQINYSPVDFVNSESTNSGDMNFDELEALLSDSSDVTIPNVNLEKNDFVQSAVVEKPVDEFDELENMLQSAFAKDVGPIKTKPSVRPTQLLEDLKSLTQPCGLM
jgi:chemosensory pili system protein ChpA (sensor histidine kinase/response regulator)